MPALKITELLMPAAMKAKATISLDDAKIVDKERYCGLQ
jgi:hypothetical protein